MYVLYLCNQSANIHYILSSGTVLDAGNAQEKKPELLFLKNLHSGKDYGWVGTRTPYLEMDEIE